jgi:gliding motility-associated-like protein
MNLTVLKQDITCYGDTDGQASVTIQGGIGPFTYAWSTNPIQTTPQATNLAAGTYTILVTDSFGCTASSQFAIDTPPRIMPLVTISPISCPGDSNGTLQVTASGGNAPYNYAWQTTPPTPGQSLTNLSAGSYVIQIRDVSGCTVLDTTVLSDPTPITINFTTVNASCSGQPDGQITASVSGGSPPYAYSWDTLGGTSSQLTNVPSGIYYLTVTDGNGCTIVDSTVLVADIVIGISVFTTDPTCPGIADGAIQVSASGGTPPYQYAWDEGSTGSSLTNITSGQYRVTATDANSCFTSETIDLVPIFDLMVDAGPDKTINSGQSVVLSPTVSPAGNYIYVWSPPIGLDDPNSRNPKASPPSNVVYTLTVSDAGGCEVSDSVLIRVKPSLNLTIPNAFSPNSDGRNDNFFTPASGIVLQIEVYNRWGEQVYVGTEPWDGTKNGTPQPVGVYVYRVLIDNGSAQSPIMKQGNVTLLR